VFIRIKAYLVGVSSSTIVNWGLFIIALTGFVMGFMTKETWMGLSLILWSEHMLVISNLLIFSQLREFMKEMNKLNNAEASKSLDYMKQELNEEVIKKKGSNKK